MEYRPNADIFETGAECIINPVNCQAHKLADMGKPQAGLAGAFQKRYPAIQDSFVKACREGKMKPGGVQLIRVDSATGERSKTGDRVIANVATKDYWADPSKIEWVDTGLRKLAAAIEERGIRSVAIPMLGAGFGKLSWEKVRDRVEAHFRPLSEKGVSVIVLGKGPERSADRSAAVADAAPAQKVAEGYGADRIFYAGIGARDTPEPVLAKMRKMGEILARKGWVLRSGAADGADSAFEEGSDRISGADKEIFLPWDGFDPLRNGKKRFADGKQVFDEVTPEHDRIAAKYHPAWDRLGRGPRSMMARNASQMLGRDLKTPSKVVVCWTEGGAVKGGTGQALRMAQDMGVQVLNLGDPRVKGMAPSVLAGIAEKLVAGEKLGPALTAARVQARAEDATR